MCFRELLNELRQHDVDVTEARVRWAIRSGKVTRPRLDASLRYDYSAENVAELVEYFREPAEVSA